MMGLFFLFVCRWLRRQILASENNTCTEGKQNKAVRKGGWQEQLKCISPKMGLVCTDTSEVWSFVSPDTLEFSSFGPIFKSKRTPRDPVHVFPVYRSLVLIPFKLPAFYSHTYQSYQSQFAIWNRACWTHSREWSFSWPVISPLPY